MIKLTPKDLAQFKEIHFRATGEQLSDEQAREYAERVLRVVAFAAWVDPR